MTVQDIMKRDLVTADAQDHLAHAGGVMRLARLRHLPVVSGGILVGMLSYRDFAETCLDLGGRGAADTFLRQTEVAALLHHAPVTIAPDGSLVEAVNRMLALRVGCLPVALPTGDGPRLVGIVTESELLRAAYP